MSDVPLIDPAYAGGGVAGIFFSAGTKPACGFRIESGSVGKRDAVTWGDLPHMYSAHAGIGVVGIEPTAGTQPAACGQKCGFILFLFKIPPLFSGVSLKYIGFDVAIPILLP